MGWWTDLAEKRGPVINSGDGDGRPGEPEDRAVECRGLILHIADGYYEGTIAWQHNPAADVSSQFVVAGPRDIAKGIPDGKIAQCVDTDERAWTQRSGNGHWLSIEDCGFSGDALSPAQIESCAQIFARGHQVYGYPLQLATSPSGRGLGHHSMGAESGVDWGHSQCPGPLIKSQKPQILAMAIAIANGTQEDGMPKLARIDDGPYGPGAIYKSDGITRARIGTMDEAHVWAQFWGVPASGYPVISWANADWLLGKDIEALSGQPGPAGPATLVPHTHTSSATGPAVATASEVAAQVRADA